MFQEAEEEDAILFLDEGDSFLRDRSLANHSWEVTTVNELLQGMERFPGVFIVATNLFRGLDTAALRRFTFKLEMRALNPEQRWNMFVSETGIKKNLAEIPRTQKDSWKADLYQMHQLAAGDFATVKRQCILLGETLSPDQWIEQLQIECDIKRESQTREVSDATPPAEGAKTPDKLVH
jgi:SpoVK/Ycf46/Vps4 family AAA+-type ATPase